MAGIPSFFRAIIDFCLPAFCLGCQAPLAAGSESLACPHCVGEIPFLPLPRCSCCGAPFRSAVGPARSCQECLADPPPFCRAQAVAFYEGLVLEAIHHLKYERQLIYGKFLAQLLRTAEIAAMVSAADLVLPVPLHSQRLRWRGFNQALVLALMLPGASVGRDLLVRQRPTLPQIKLSHRERRDNVKGAFSVPRPATVAGKAVLLVDDVYTTGATVKECARALLRAGAGSVEVLTVARVGYA